VISLFQGLCLCFQMASTFEDLIAGFAERQPWGDLAMSCEIFLERDGTLSKPPQIVGPQSGSKREHTLRAARRCAPFHIPSRFDASHEQWKKVQIQFCD